MALDDLGAGAAKAHIMTLCLGAAAWDGRRRRCRRRHEGLPSPPPRRLPHPPALPAAADDNCWAEPDDPPLERYSVMRDALNRTGRPILYSACEWGMH